MQIEKEKNQTPKLILIDGNHLIHRAFYAIRNPLSTRSGEPTNALYGFVGMIMNIIDQEQPDYFAVTFDEKAPTFRHEAHSEYKATRTKAPDELYVQIPRIKEMLHAFNASCFSKEGYEADDLMGTLACLAKSEGLFTYIVTGDMDMLQLINESVSVVFPHKGYKEPFYYQKEEVYEKYSIWPSQVVDYKAMVGDSSDNIRGVDGIGPKGAAKLLAEYKTLDGIYDHLSDLPEKVKEKLVRDRDQAYFARSLATIVIDAPVDFKPSDLSVELLDYPKLLRFCEMMEMKSIVGRLKRMLPPDRLQAKDQMSLF